MGKTFAKIISTVFHPLLIPSLGMVLLFNSGFYFEMLNSEARHFVMLVVFFTTCILPLLFISVLSLNPRFNINMPNCRDRVLPLLGSAMFYYFGSLLMNRIPIIPEFKLFMLASMLVLILLLLISLKWKISMHMAAIGGLTGTLLALSFKHGVNPVYPILTVTLISGLLGTARLILKKHNTGQLVAGYFIGFLFLYMTVYFL